MFRYNQDTEHIQVYDTDNSLWLDFPIEKKTLHTTFTHSNVSGGSILVGTIPINSRVSLTTLEITTSFNNSTTCTIGESGAQGRLMIVSENNASLIETYQSFNSHLFTTNTELYLYFPSGTPDQGEGQVTIFYQ